MRGVTPESRRGRLFAVESLAGWVFADMLLLLFVVGMASAIPQPPPEPSTVPTPEPTTEPSSEPTLDPEIIGMRPQPEDFSISFDAAALLSSASTGPAAESVCSSLHDASRPLEGERAAFVLIFGGAAEPTIGQEIARRVEEQLQCADDSLFPAETVVRPYWSGSIPYGQADLEVFTFTTKQTDALGDEKE